jgi:hypothetical protein
MRRLWCLSLCACAVSCGSKLDYGSHPPHPVSGQILVNGQPADDANIVLYHVGAWEGRSAVPYAFTDEEGRFKLSTYGTDDGAPNGEYQVEVTWPAYRNGRNIGPDRLDRKYENHKTNGLKVVTIEENTRELPPIELKADLSKVKSDSNFKGKGKGQKNQKNRNRDK